MLRVSSKNNPRLKEASRLVASSRDRRKAGKCVLEGEHLVEAYAQRHGSPETLIVTEAFLERPEARRLAERFDARTIVVPEALFDELAVLPAGVGMLAVVGTPKPAMDNAGDFCLLLDDVQDPGNVGSMLRSAAAAGVSHALLSPHCAFAWSPKVLRAAMGAHFQLSVYEDMDLPQWSRAYRERGGRVVATVREGGVDLYRATLARPLAIAIGNEGAGLSPALLDAASDRLTIPMPGCVESLNAAAATAVVLFECVRQQRITRTPA
jgi:RNA methyltransferase, TrmH family